MKRVVSVLLAVVMVFTLCSCSLFPEPTSAVETEEEFEYYEGKNKTSSKSDTSSKGNKKDKTEGTVEVAVSDDKGTSSGAGSSSGTSGSSSTSSQSTSSGSSSSSGGSNADYIPKEEELDLTGKTIYLAVTTEPQYGTASFQAMVSAFENKYKCTVKEETLSFGSFNGIVKNKKSAGRPYDICYVHGSKFPEGPQLGLYADLTDYIYELDASYYDSEKTNSFKWGVRSYGICNTYSAYPYIFYYNKALFNANGLEDPRTLYNNGTWTWDKMFEQGAAATNPASNIYYLSSNFKHTNIYGVSSITVINGKVHLNLHDSKTIASLNLVKRIYSGNIPIGKRANDSNPLGEFIAGRNYMFIDDSSKYPEIWPQAKKSDAFAKNDANLGIVPIPLPAENTDKAYPTGWHIAICAGEGSDPRIAVTWAKFVASYKTTVRGAGELSQADQELMDSIMRGTTVPNRQGVFSDGSVDTLTLYDRMTNEVKAGGNVNSIVDSYYNAFCNCIRSTLGSNEFYKN